MDLERPDSRPVGRRLRQALVLFLPVVALAVVAAALLELRSRGTEGVSGITVANFRAVARAGDRPAPGFELPALDGNRKMALSDFAGKTVVLNFWASWCVPCRDEAPELQATWQAYRSRGVQFVGVNFRDDGAAARAYEREFGITYPSVYDPAGQLAFDYRLIGLPTTFVITPEGRIAFQFTGKIDRAVLSEALDDVLARSPS